jgi:extradiol dioxygenase family protein
MTPQETQETTNLARRIDQNLKKIFLTQFGHVLTLDEWKALPFATRRAIDKQARQQAYHVRGN